MRNLILVLIKLTFLSSFVFTQEQPLHSKAIQIDHLFIPNKGQLGRAQSADQKDVLFSLSASGMNLYLTDHGLSYFFYKAVKDEGSDSEESEPIPWERIDLDLPNAVIQVENISALYPGNNGVYNYYNPNCPSGITSQNEYRKLVIKEIYPGIDWEIYISESEGLKYDFILHPGASTESIEFEYLSRKPLQLVDGNIQIETQFGNFTEKAPISYFNNNITPSTFEIRSSVSLPTIGFKTRLSVHLDSKIQTLIADRSAQNVLVIDPIILWSTFYGAELAEGGTCIATDSQNSVYVGGYRMSLNCPLYDNGVSFFQGVFTSTWGGIILKFDELGKRLWVTHYDGSNSEEIRDIAIDHNDHVVFIGYTASADLPLLDQGNYYQNNSTINGSAGFIIEFLPDGQLKWATHFGNGGNVTVNSVDFDNNGNLLITGRTNWNGIPYVDAGTFYMEGSMSTQRDAFVSKFDQNRNLVWSTSLGGSPGSGSAGNDSAMGIASDESGNIYVTGQAQSSDFPLQSGSTYYDNTLTPYVDAFLHKFDAAGNLVWGTFFGGNNDDWGQDVYVDQSGFVYISGMTKSSNLPVTNQSTYQGNMDLYLFKFNQIGAIIWGTYVGDYGEEYATYTYPMIMPENYFRSKMITVDKCGNVFFGFETESESIPTTKFCDDCYHVPTNAGSRNQFLMAFSPSGSVLGATYIGGIGSNFRCAITLDSKDNLWMTGEWSEVADETSYPLVEGDTSSYFDTSFNGNPDDIFVMKMLVKKAVNCGADDEELLPNVAIEMPNVFTPNQNEGNEYFKSIKAEGIAVTRWYILNRWGELVFEAFDLTSQWDGNDLNGKPVSEGTYFWIIEGTDVKYNQVKQHGSVQVIR